jgi:hypothetical protein
MSAALALAFPAQAGDDSAAVQAAAWPPPVLLLQIDPPGAWRGHAYRGTLRCASGEAVFGDGMVIQVRAFRPAALAGLRVSARTDSILSIECNIAADAAGTEALFVELTQGERQHEASVLLRTVDPTWDPSWRPHAVAPADTVVPDSTSLIVLDARRSRHPAGLRAMHFRWSVDDGAKVIKGNLETSTTLGAGRHTVVLVAEDAFGYVSTDTMRVWVGPERP